MPGTNTVAYYKHLNVKSLIMLGPGLKNHGRDKHSSLLQYVKSLIMLAQLWKTMAGINTLAYCLTPSVTKKKFFEDFPQNVVLSAEAGNTNWKGWLSTVDLLIKKVCFV